jgi:predicted esterase
MSDGTISKPRLGYGIIMALFSLLLLAACSISSAIPTAAPSVTPPPTPTPTIPIKPGDRVSGVLVTTGTADSKFLFDLPCTKKDGADQCNVPFGISANVTAAVYGVTPEELQANWETFVYSFTINGQPVDLPAFGTIDFVHKRTGLFMRAYNLAVISSEPITLTTHDVASVQGDTVEGNTLITFKSAVADDPIQPLSTAAERPGQHPYASKKTNFDLLLYLPGEYGKDPQQTWPLIISLHGGPNVTNLDWVRIKPLAVQLDNQLEFPFIVASPLHTGEYQHWSQADVMDDLLALLAELQTSLAINPSQIYLAGFIEGANGVWSLGLAHPEIFAALVPVSGYTGYPFAVPENICVLKDMPIWAFHGADDPDIPPSAQQMLIDALKACGSNTIQFTIYPGTNPEIYHTVFADPALYAWLSEQSK